ncbi:BEN domain-containing protein 7 [Engraulis encrasicolus]|uniref:BEN domain-containing protein 7 n=1 Tax=Engraulis encrasicolus TaxID=184585 RepID=UPI002FD0E050
MEFAERRRSRKSQSFKLINEQELQTEYFDRAVSTAANGDSRECAKEAWSEDEGMEIKRQITGMMRVLNDKAGRVYQRVGREGENLRQGPQDELLSWASQSALDPEQPQHSNWTCSPQQPNMSLSSGQYSTRSKTQKMLNQTKDLSTNANACSEMAVPQPPVVSAVKSTCCTCNCKGTLQAILLELRTMRKLMQTQKGPQQQQATLSGTCSTRCPVTRRRARKRRPVHRVAPLTTPTNGAAAAVPSSQPPPHNPPNDPSVNQRESAASVSTPFAATLPGPASIYMTPPIHHYSAVQGPNASEPEVQLAEDYDVFIPKAQLDSILVNYTRSGSLLFRKLVCAFFDDTTLANSLPNGKRKRGLNDHRKGLDQNIVGAIKVFTEKYCTANRIEKLPGARDWVQILQDQIKLARRRLKRGVL